MISGIVYFEEIVEGIKDETGITNLYPYYDKIRRFIVRAEQDISAGGLIIRKTKSYINGDGEYDGTFISLPKDMMGEYSYADMNTVYYRGDKLEFIDAPGPDEIDLSYMGTLFDQNGNPITTRNHYDAVVNFCVWKLYAPKMFLGVGNANIFRNYQMTYENLVMASRGNDAFPSESDWEDIGKTLSMSYFDAMTNNGIEPIVADAGLSGNPVIDPIGNLTVDMVAVWKANLIPPIT